MTVSNFYDLVNQRPSYSLYKLVVSPMLNITERVSSIKKTSTSWMLYDLVGVDSNWSNYGSHQGDNGEEIPEETYFIFLNQTMGQRFSQVLSTSKNNLWCKSTNVFPK